MDNKKIFIAVTFFLVLVTFSSNNCMQQPCQGSPGCNLGQSSYVKPEAATSQVDYPKAGLVADSGEEKTKFVEKVVKVIKTAGSYLGGLVGALVGIKFVDEIVARFTPIKRDRNYGRRILINDTLTIESICDIGGRISVKNVARSTGERSRIFALSLPIAGYLGLKIGKRIGKFTGEKLGRFVGEKFVE